MVSGTNFLTGILFARFLGLEEFGRFTIVWLAVQFISSIQMAMISSPMMSIAPKQREDEKCTYFGAVLIQQLVFAVVTSLLIYIGVQLSAVYYPSWRIQNLALPLAITTFCFQFQDFIRRLFFTQGRAVAAFLNDVVSYLGQLILLFYFFYSSQLDTANVLYIIAATSFMALYGLFFIGKVSWSFDVFKETNKRSWRFSKWMVASSLLQYASGNLFLIASGSILGATAVGALKASQNIIGITHIFFQGLENIVPSRASWHYAQTGMVGLLSYLKKVSLWGGGATLFVILVITMMSDILLGFIYGEEYIPYGYVVKWYGAIYLLIFLGLPLKVFLRSIEHARPVFIAYVLMTVFSVISVNFLLQVYGVIGALLGILVTQIILLTTLFYSVKKAVKDQ